MLAHMGHVMTLANSIIGVGILAMPFCFQKCGILLSIVLLIVSNWVTRICCHYLIKISLLTRRKSYEFLGFHAFGTSGKLLVELCIIGYLLGTCITYFVVVGDLGPQIITKMFALEGGHMHLRTWIMVAVTLVCILPLGMLKNVDSLSTVCAASIGFYVCLVVKIVLESGEHIVANDWTQKVVYWEPAGVLQCLPIFSMALSCQMQLFEVFGSINNQSLEKLNSIVRNATWICTFVYIAVGFFGYVAFCTQKFSGNILMNFSPSFGSDVIKIGFILAVAFSFPLVIFPCRASIYSLLYRKGHTDASGYIPEARFKGITIFIVGLALCIALMIPSVELIIGLVGSTIGVAICIMFPASCFRKIIRKESTERILAQFILISGFCLMILGTYANLHAIDENSSGAHLQLADVEEHMIEPTLLPLSIEQDKMDLLAQRLNNAEMEYNKKEQHQLQEQLPKSGDAEKPKEQLRDERVQPVGGMADLVPPAPPFPVDEAHNEDVKQSVPKNEQVEKSPDKLQVILPIPDEEKIELLESNKIAPKLAVNDKPAAEKIITPPGIKLEVKEEKKENIPNRSHPAKPQPQQTIDKDAIKKDEEIAAEESNKETKSNAEELKETQNELKKTKELLERTVDELREELAKQNKETQNLVVEKLGEVVEKVEEIERKVQKNEPQTPPSETSKVAAAAPAQAAPDAPESKTQIAAEMPQQLNKGSLLSILTENANTKNEPNVPPPPGQVYEPLSYKTGELMEHAKNDSKLEQRVPLPLALLINASQTKMNENVQGSRTALDIKSAAAPQKPKESSLLLKSEVKRELPDTQQESVNPPAVDVAPLPPATPQQPQALDKFKALQREIVEVHASKMQDIKALLTPTATSALRAKRASGREAPDFEAVNLKLQQENCLHEPKVETLMAHGMSNALDFKMNGIIHDLKSLKEQEHT